MNKRLIVILVVLLLAASIAGGGWYVKANPDSLLSYAVFRAGIKWLEPTWHEVLEGAPMIDETIKSYSSVKAMTDFLDANDMKWESAERSNIVVIPLYKHLGHSGKLKLRFFNDRLSDVYFMPEDTDAYLKDLGGSLGRDVGEGTCTTFRRKVRLECRRDLDGVLYLWWRDERFEKESRAWVMRYA